jgi:AmmeMemoRadiSam system protein B/AmmeMemoRadiSam system protein A
MFRRHIPVFYSLLIVFFIHGCSGEVKEPAVAGYFYPADKNVLGQTVDQFISRAGKTPVDGRLIALIAPHAGYQFSGSVAAYSYRQIQESGAKTVILIGPSHHKAFRGVSVYDRGSMKTPLGLMKIDRKIARSLINKDADVTFYPDAFEKEHSLEVQLPFIQRLFKKVKIVPILVGTPTRKSYDHITGRLAEIMRNDDRTILIASTDLSHYHDYDKAVKKDRKVIDAVERMSVEDVQKLLVSGEGEMCGGYPVLYTMAVARALGATNGVLYKYANSGDVTGDKSRVVGYTSIGLYKSPLSKTARRKLLDLAQETVKHYVKTREPPGADISDKRLVANGATFVTIKTESGFLRGCMGNIMPTMPLYQSVIRNAVSAASSDPRFPPMKEQELKGMDVEVTVLSPFVPVKDESDIEIGRHGLYIVKGDRSGLLLPQVAGENHWDRETFLRQVSKKAGLPEDAWKTAQLFTFTGEIIR